MLSPRYPHLLDPGQRVLWTRAAVGALSSRWHLWERLALPWYQMLFRRTRKFRTCSLKPSGWSSGKTRTLLHRNSAQAGADLGPEPAGLRAGLRFLGAYLRWCRNYLWNHVLNLVSVLCGDFIRWTKTTTYRKTREDKGNRKSEITPS